MRADPQAIAEARTAAARISHEPQRLFALHVIDLIESMEPGKGSLLTVNDLSEAYDAGSEPDNQEVIQRIAAMTVLCGGRNPILQVAGFLPENGARIRVSPFDITAALAGDRVEHPVTGEILEDPAERIIFAFDVIMNAPVAPADEPASP